MGKMNITKESTYTFKLDGDAMECLHKALAIVLEEVRGVTAGDGRPLTGPRRVNLDTATASLLALRTDVHSAIQDF